MNSLGTVYGILSLYCIEKGNSSESLHQYSSQNERKRIYMQSHPSRLQELGIPVDWIE
jgi:hypothetical protein